MTELEDLLALLLPLVILGEEGKGGFDVESILYAYYAICVLKPHEIC